MFTVHILPSEHKFRKDNSVSIREDKGRNFKPRICRCNCCSSTYMAFKEASTPTGNHVSSKLEIESSADGPEPKNDCSTFGQSLIKFMSLATGSVKIALQKPANYKKNINHRRYLQKQLKICTRRKKRNTKSKSAAASKKTPPEAERFGMPEAEVWLRGYQGQQHGQTFARQGACSGNQILPVQGNACLPFEASFQTSNGVLSSLERSLHDLATGTNNQVAFFTPHSVGVAQNGRDLSHLSNNGGTFRDDLLLPEVIMEETESFLTGEELTRTLDIKDLFVPDRNEYFEVSEEAGFFSYSSIDKTVYNGFQTIPSTTNIISW